MKRIVLAFMIPAMTTCGDHPAVAIVIKAWQVWSSFSTQHPYIAQGIKQTAIHTVSQEMKNSQIRDELKSIREELNRIEREKEKRALIEKAKKEEIELATSFDRCLNTNFCGSENDHGFPKRCNSPARRYASINSIATEARIAEFRKRKVGIKQQQFRVLV